MLKITKTLSGCKNDKLVIMRMKLKGVWEKMQKNSVDNKLVFIISGHDLFIWHGATSDSGYSHFRSKKHIELLRIMSKLSDQTPQRETIH